MSRRKRIGIMGGTFDPVHMVHLTLAENAYHSFGLDEVLMLPNGDPPHKTDKIITPAVHRLAMLQLAVAGIPYFRISDMEIRRKGYSYSSVTLEELKKAHPDTDYYFIMGADSLFAFETWHEPQKICQNCVIVAAVRDHVSAEHFKEQIEYLTQKYQVDIRILATPNIDISSHEIREWIRKANTSLKYYVPDKVISYIKEKNLYSECKE